MERRVAFGQAALDGMKRLRRVKGGGIGLFPSMVDIEVACALLPSIESEDPLQVPGHCHQAPLAADLVEPAQQELAKAENRFDDPEHRLRGVLSPGVELLAFGRGQAVRHGVDWGRVSGAGGAAAKRSSRDG